MTSDQPGGGWVLPSQSGDGSAVPEPPLTATPRPGVPTGPVAGGPYPSGPGVPYPPPRLYQHGYGPGPAPARGRRRLVWGLAIGGVVLLLVGAGVLAARGKAEREADQRAAAVAVVEEYLGAVAAADADRVRELLPDYLDDGSTALITDEVLAASAALAPLTDIQVALVSVTESEYHPEAEIRATYRLGGDQAVQTFAMSGSVSSGGTEWNMVGSTATYSGASLDGIEVAVNGQVAPSGDDELHLVVPGAYQVTATSPYYRLDQADLRLTDPSSSQLRDIVPTLTDEGKQAFRTAVRGAVDACLASKDLVAGCGLDLEATLSNGTVDDGTLTRTLTPEAEAALAVLEPRLEASRPSIATCGVIGGVTTTATGTVDGQRGTIEITEGFAGLGGTLISLKNPSVTMTDPALPVTW